MINYKNVTLLSTNTFRFNYFTTVPPPKQREFATFKLFQIIVLFYTLVFRVLTILKLRDEKTEFLGELRKVYHQYKNLKCFLQHIHQYFVQFTHETNQPTMTSSIVPIHSFWFWLIPLFMFMDSFCCYPKWSQNYGLVRWMMSLLAGLFRE